MKKLNNKSGFTVIELILSFVFVFTLAFSTYQIVFNYKEKRDQESYRTQMKDYKNEVTLAIQKDVTERIINRIDYCNNGGVVVEKCLNIFFNDGTKKQLSVESEPKEYDGETKNVNYIKYGEIKYESDESFLVKFPSNYMLYSTVETDEVGTNVTIYKIAIPIRHNELGNEDFGVYVTAIGYNYEEPGAEPTPPPTVIPGTSEGLTVPCKTDITGSTGQNLTGQTIIIRYKIASFNTSTGTVLLSDLNHNKGSAIALDPTKKICYKTYVKAHGGGQSSMETTCGTSAQAANTWYTVVVTFSASGSSATKKIYIDGDLNKTETITANNIFENHSMSFGIAYEPGTDFNTAYFDGTISDVIIINGAVMSEADAKTVSGNLRTSTSRNIVKNYQSSTILDADFTEDTTYDKYCN